MKIIKSNESVELIPSNFNRIPENIGVYKIYVFDKSENTPCVIPRFSSHDNSGLVYIGMAYRQGLRKRLKNFETSLRRENTRNHTAAIKLWKRDKLHSLRDGRFFVWFIKLEDVALVKQQEKEYLLEYLNDFGETPLLNG